MAEVSETQPEAALRKHYTLAEIAAAWGMNIISVRRIFTGVPGVMVRGGAGLRRSFLRIPSDVLDRVYRERLAK
jgi:hypothetical protein